MLFLVFTLFAAAHVNAATTIHKTVVTEGIEQCQELTYDWGTCSSVVTATLETSMQFNTFSSGACPADYTNTFTSQPADISAACPDASIVIAVKMKSAIATQPLQSCATNTTDGQSFAAKQLCKDGWLEIIYYFGKTVCTGEPTFTQYNKLKTCSADSQGEPGTLLKCASETSIQVEMCQNPTTFTEEVYNLYPMDKCTPWMFGYYAKHSCAGDGKDSWMNKNVEIYSDSGCTDILAKEYKTLKGCEDSKESQCFDGYIKEKQCTGTDGEEKTDSYNINVNKCNIFPPNPAKSLKVLTCATTEATLTTYDTIDNDKLGSCVDGQKEADHTWKVNGGCNNQLWGKNFQAWCVDGFIRVKECETYDENAAAIDESTSEQATISGNQGGLVVPGGTTTAAPSGVETFTFAFMAFLMLFY